MSKAPSPRLSEAVESFLNARHATLASSTAEQDTFVCGRFVAAMGDPLVRNLRADAVELWFHSLLRPHTTRDGRERAPVQASTYNYYYARIKALSVYLSRRGLLTEDPLAHVSPLRRAHKERVRAEGDVLWEIIDSAENARDRALLTAAINTGLRANELAELRVGDVALDSFSLRVRISKSKTEDDMPLTSDLHAELERWLEVYRAEVMRDHARMLLPTDRLFPARTGPLYAYRKAANGAMERYHRGQRLLPDRPIKKLHVIAQRALEAVGIPSQHQGIHTLRRSAARAVFDSMVAENGYDGALRVTSSFLHHSNSSTTEVYLGMDRERRVRDDHLRGRSLLGHRPGSARGVVVRPSRWAAE